MRRWVARFVLLTAGLVWAGGLALGVHRLARYETTAGPQLPAAETWPDDAPARTPDTYTLALFLHPECPCSRATISALDKIVAHHPRLAVFVFAVLPDGAPAEWHTSDLLADVQKIPRVQLVKDPHAHFAREFAALTSGQADLYDPAGQRVFSGGITKSRGHEGPSTGAASIEAILRGQKFDAAETPVFGCSLTGCSRTE